MRRHAYLTSWTQQARRSTLRCATRQPPPFPAAVLALFHSTAAPTLFLPMSARIHATTVPPPSPSRPCSQTPPPFLVESNVLLRRGRTVGHLQCCLKCACPLHHHHHHHHPTPLQNSRHPPPLNQSPLYSVLHLSLNTVHENGAGLPVRV